MRSDQQEEREQKIGELRHGLQIAELLPPRGRPIRHGAANVGRGQRWQPKNERSAVTSRRGRVAIVILTLVHETLGEVSLQWSYWVQCRWCLRILGKRAQAARWR